jgi:hypothetical protein
MSGVLLDVLIKHPSKKYNMVSLVRFFQDLWISSTRQIQVLLGAAVEVTECYNHGKFNPISWDMGPIELKLYIHFYWNCTSKCHGTEANGQHIFQFFLHLLTPRQAPILAASSGGGYGTVACKTMFWWHGA